MDPILIKIGTSLATRLSMPLAKGIVVRLLGPEEKRAFDKVCATAVQKAADYARSPDMTDNDFQHLLGLLDRLIAVDGPELPLLPQSGTAIDAAVLEWQVAAEEFGYSLKTFPVAFDDLIRKLLELVPQEVSRSARLHDNALFRTVALENIEYLREGFSRISSFIETSTPRSIMMAAELRRVLDDKRAACEAANLAFLTPHLLLAILEMPERHAKRCFIDVRPDASPDLGTTVNNLLRRYEAETRLSPYRPFDWIERADFRAAQAVAAAVDAPAVHELHMLLGVLRTRSVTRDELAAWLADDFARLCSAVMRRINEPGLPKTPRQRIFRAYPDA